MSSILSKYKILIIVISNFLVLTSSFIWLDFDENEVYDQSSLLLNTFHEQDSIRHSKVNLLSSSDSIEFEYKLSKNLQEPFAGIYLHPKNENEFFDFGKYNEIQIYLRSQKGKRIPFYLTLNESSFTTPNDVFSNLPMSFVVDYKNEGWYSISKNDLQIPSWWLREYGLKKSEVFDVDFSRVNYLMLYSCQILSPGEGDKITIKAIKFVHNNTLVYIIHGLVLLLLNSVLWIFYKKKNTIIVPYVAQNFINNKSKSNDKEIILNLIAQHYFLSDLSLDWLNQKSKISNREIGNIFKTQLNTSFKEYLNLIRLTEAKRLLINSSLSVSEIAYKVGYNNITHFNRVFKEKNGISPSEFREQKNK